MSQDKPSRPSGKPAKEPDRARPFEDRVMRAGDIMVTAVGDRYAIGRLKADLETQEPLGWKEDRDEALKKACALAGTIHQGFLYARVSHTTLSRYRLY